MQEHKHFFFYCSSDGESGVLTMFLSFKIGSVSILGSDDATTCHIVVLRHTGIFKRCSEQNL